ncbi:alpha/beta fold hydrolase [Chamaesiphon minutus]|uniref:Putative hydrolase or acyltransferase of alpha/beta superfamily n=1 Tax=Chamaesiphon minutus (strain ATCC 27169 / PCC 6605) TaxID=1173020 RepID=K9UPK7_CHAP6|nr:alpha/beta fold hydrolase [Chamaesiphon minutus]AFY96346.1 putative hydrolase or acyltransferase of alpha/beta superfamily [Chamaesiphon minutus PCC 6605]
MVRQLQKSVTPPPDLYMSVNGINTRYWQMGERGSTIILLHGGNGSIEFWLYNIANLAKHHCVYAIDMVGSGKSDCPDGSYSLGYQAEFLHGAMAALAIDTATLIGNSMGGGIAIEFTRLYPDRVAKLVLVDSMGFGREISLGIRLITLPTIVSLLRPGRWMIPAMLRSNFYNGQQLPPEWMELRYPIFALPDRHRVILKMGQSNFNLAGVLPQVYQPILDSLANITQRTLIIWGAQDRIIPVKHAYIAAASLPNSQLQIFPNCGHHPYLEYPAKFDRLVLEFLAS